MPTHTGQLYDLGPDGLGFIAEAGSDRVWAFHYPSSGCDLAPDVPAFVLLEGEMVRFTIEGARVGSIARIKVTSR